MKNYISFSVGYILPRYSGTRSLLTTESLLMQKQFIRLHGKYALDIRIASFTYYIIITRENWNSFLNVINSHSTNGMNGSWNKISNGIHFKRPPTKIETTGFRLKDNVYLPFLSGDTITMLSIPLIRQRPYGLYL